MKSVIRIFLAALTLSLSSYCSQSDIVKKAHSTTHIIRAIALSKDATCSATAIGKHALLTASHCEVPSVVLVVDGRLCHVVRMNRDAYDHTIMFLSGIEFDTWAVFAKTLPEQGDDVFMFGNPSNDKDIYRRGYLTGFTNAAYNGITVRVALFDLHSFHGDSGAAFFNDKGEIVAVMSVMQTYKNDGEDAVMVFSGTFPLGFTEEDFNKAREF
jgi:hypothetical protein